MNPAETAVAEIAAFLEERGLPYMLFGGMAVLVWGRMRTTQDVDFKVEAGEGQELLRACSTRFRMRAADAGRFLAETQTIPISVEVDAKVAVAADLVLASLPYESAAIRRALDIEIGGRVVKVCSPEDLILHKIVSERQRDQEDVRGVILRQAASLDRRYLEPKLKELAEALARPGIWELYQNSLKRAREIGRP